MKATFHRRRLLTTAATTALGASTTTTWPAISSYLEIDASFKIRDHLLSLLEQVQKA